jgi:hypothetical protein
MAIGLVQSTLLVLLSVSIPASPSSPWLASVLLVDVSVLARSIFAENKQEDKYINHYIP